MKEIALTNGGVTIVDDVDYEVLSQSSWYRQKARNTWYACTHATKDGRPTLVRMHTVILPGCVTVDHWDGDGLNNRRSNLRPATLSQNQQNSIKPRSNTSGFKGVNFVKRSGRWQANITVDGKARYLGTFDTKEEAARTYDEAAKEFHGEFARQNFTEEPVR